MTYHRLFAPCIAAILGWAAPAYADWSGCYVGGNAGWARVHSSEISRDALVFGPGNNLGSNESDHFIGGGQIGCDYQFDRSVIGIQGTADWGSLYVSNIDPLNPVFSMHSQFRNYETLTARIGFVPQPGSLIYVKGGAAFGDGHYWTIRSVGPLRADANSDRTGWTLGGGVEYALAPNWSVFVEYDHVNFGTASVALTNLFQFPGPLKVDYNQNLHTILFGLNYRFGAH